MNEKIEQMVKKNNALAHDLKEIDERTYEKYEQEYFIEIIENMNQIIRTLKEIKTGDNIEAFQKLEEITINCIQEDLQWYYE